MPTISAILAALEADQANFAPFGLEFWVSGFYPIQVARDVIAASDRYTWWDCVGSGDTARARLAIARKGTTYPAL